MHKTFGDLIRNLVEMYIDDIVIKVKSSASLLDNLALVFDRLCVTRTKLNPEKCVFGVTAGKLLGFLKISGQSKPCGLLPASRTCRSSRNAWPR
jgi:hypothetical protein